MGMQYTVMNTLIYTDLDVKYASMASSMASTTQYLSMSFGIAMATMLMQALLHGQGNMPTWWHSDGRSSYWPSSRPSPAACLPDSTSRQKRLPHPPP
jgi:hypothetical protein